MPKRKCSREDEEDINYLEKKIRKLERKLRESRPAKRRRHGRSRSRSLSRRRRRSKTRSYTRSRSRSRSHLGLRVRSVSPSDSRRSSPHVRRDPEQSEVHSAIDLVCSEQPEQTSEVLPPPCNESAPACEPVIDTVLVEGAEDTQELDGTILEILGDDPTSINTFGGEIQKDLAVRLQHCVTNGLTKEIKKEFIEKYLTPSNCKLINAPVLNAEIKAAIPETVAKRDKAIEIKQKQLASAITALCQALTRLLSSKEKDTGLIKLLMDTSRILCDCQYTDSVTRRNFVLSTLKKDMKDQVQTTKVDSFLFGENFADTIKTAKAITKSGAELKATTNTKMQSVVKKPSTGLSKNLNWKSPFPSRRQTDGPRTRESATTKNPPSSSSRPSQRRAPPRNTRR